MTTMTQRVGIPSGLPAESSSVPDGKSVWSCERDGQSGREGKGDAADFPSACQKTSD